MSTPHPMNRAFVPLALMVLLLPLSGCLGQTDTTQTTSEETTYTFQHCSLQGLQGGQVVYMVRGCPKRLFEAHSPMSGYFGIPDNATGVHLRFEHSPLDPYAESTIQVERAGKTVLDRSITFVAGMAVDQEGSYREGTTIVTDLVLARCDMDDLQIQWTPHDVAGARLLIEVYVDDSGLPPGEGMCNGYWGPS